MQEHLKDTVKNARPKDASVFELVTWAKKPQLVDIPLAQIKYFIPYRQVALAGVLKYLESQLLVGTDTSEVIKVLELIPKRCYVLIDGNHRLCTSWINQRSSITAQVLYPIL